MTDGTFVRLTDRTLSTDVRLLVAHWTEYLKARGISARHADRAGVRLDYADGSLVFHYMDHQGSPTDFIRWRQFDGEPKFLQEEGTGNHAYMPPLADKSRMPDVLRDPSVPLVIAEGETRALALTEKSIPAVAIGGIHNFGKRDELCRDLATIRWTGREVTYIFDSDVSLRPSLQDGVLRLAELLERRGAHVKLLPIPDLGDGNTGADDFIAARGKREFVKLLKTAKSRRHPEFASWGKDGIQLDLQLNPVSHDWLHKTPPPLEFTWDGYLTRGSVGLLVAVGGAGKTFLAQALAQAVAGGQPFLQRPTRQGRAVHIAFEEVSDELRRRTYRIFQRTVAELKDSGLSKVEIERFANTLPNNLYIKSVVGQELHLAVMDGSNVVQGRALDTLIFQLRELGDVELVIVDPLSRAHSIDSESQAWGTTIINACERIAQEVGCTVLLTHHTGKGTSASKKKREDLYAARGASALADAARVVLVLAEATAEDTRQMTNITADDLANHRVLRLINAKLSYGPRQKDLWIFRDNNGVLLPFEPKTKGVPGFKGHLDQLHHFVTATKQQPFSIRQIQRSRAEIFDDPQVSEREVTELIKRAQSFGSLIEAQDKSGGWPRLQFSDDYQPGDAP